ncbi:MAG: hypothetical protein KDB60_00865 [Propionibacteriaceae bacterium]|nr:hypothetical protein [Propionibacteriaceae bacterium]
MTTTTPRQSHRPFAHLAALAAAIAGAVLFSACGNATVPVVPASQPAATPSATAVATAEATPEVAANMELVQVDGYSMVVPKGFRFPEGTKVDSYLGLTVFLDAPASTVVLAFYRDLLPSAGYTIDADVSGMISWEGHGLGGSVVTHGEQTMIAWGDYPPSPGPAVTGPDDTPLTARDLNLSNVPFFIRFPAGTQLSDVQDTKAGARFRFDAPDPATALAFYTELLAHVQWERASRRPRTAPRPPSLSSTARTGRAC